MSGESHQQFFQRVLSFTLWENLFKPISPLLELVCAGLFVGGAWGRYKFYESLVYLLFRISLMGMDKGVIWYYSQVEEKAYLKAVFRALSWCFLTFGILAVLALASRAGRLPFTEWMFGGKGEAFGIALSGFLQYLLVVPMMLISELCIQANVNRRNLKYRILVSGITIPLVTFGMAIAGYFIVPNRIALSLCLLCGNAVGAAVAVGGFLRVHRPTWGDISLVPIPPRQMIRYSSPLAGANIFSAVAVRIDIFMLAGLGGVKSVEVFAVVTMIGKSLTSIRQSFENLLLSAFSSSGQGPLTLKFKHYFNYATWLVMNIQSVFLAFAIFFGSESLGLISPQYAAGQWVLVATAFFVYLNTASDFSVLLALGLGRTRIVPLAQVAFFGVNLGLNFLLIPRWDALGAAVALGVANLMSGVLYFLFVAYSHKSSSLLREYWFSIGVGALLLGIPAVWSVHVGATVWVKAALFALALCATFWIQRAWHARFNRILRTLE